MGQLSDKDAFMIKAAHVLVGIDGVITPEENAAFLKAMKSIVAGSSVASVRQVFEEAKALVLDARPLLESSSEEEYVKYLVDKLWESCNYSSYDLVAIRAAFVVWIGLAFADSRYDSLERKAVKRLQKLFNGILSPGEKISDRLLSEIEDICETSIEIVKQKDGIDGSVTAGKERIAELEKSFASLQRSVQSLIQFDV